MYSVPARTPGPPRIGRDQRSPTPNISSSGPGASAAFEVGVGDRWATLMASKAFCKSDFVFV